VSAQVKLKHLDRTIRSEKKRTVESMVSRLVAQWVVYGVIAEMLPPSPGLSRLKYHHIAKNSPKDKECLTLAGVHGCRFVIRDKRTYDTTAGWMAAKWMRELGQLAGI
jgi:hypothetical protein